MNGIINLDKPPGISSAAAVARVKRFLPRGTKIGHAGTLDPFATGVLLLLVGKATKLCESLMDQPKQYRTTVRLGATTATDDPESPAIPTPDLLPVDRAAIDAAIPRFIGPIQQRPPIYSALKIAGRPAYKLARQGAQLNLPPRTVHVYAIQILAYAWPDLDLLIDCGRGTYIRAIARDLGQALATGAHLTALQRTRVGDFHIEHSVSLDQLTADGVAPHLHPLPTRQGPDA